MVPLLSPPNSPWGQQSMDSGINFGNFSSFKSSERRDASALLSSQGAGQHARGGGTGERRRTVLVCRGGPRLHRTQRGVQGRERLRGQEHNRRHHEIAEHSVSLLICRDLGDWQGEIVQYFAQDVSVYRMNERGSIVRVSPEVADWQVGRKVPFALDLKQLHPGRMEALHYGL